MCRPAQQVVVFLGTEAVAVVDRLSVLAIGLVRSGDAEFYAEVVGADRRGTASPCMSDVVVPQFGKAMGAACNHRELGARLAGFLDGLTSTLPSGQLIKVAYDSDRNWQLLERAVAETHPERWTRLRTALQPVRVHNLPGVAAGACAAKRCVDSRRFAFISRHHALCDAHALRTAYDAATAWDADVSTGTPAVSEPHWPWRLAVQRQLAVIA